MKLNEDIAKNMTKQSPEVVSVFWSTLSTDLNALGPPAKSVSEWKKVWSDFKSSIKKKMSHNRSQIQATGGGPNAEIPLNALEEEVAQLICIQDTTTGVSGRKNYGVPQGPRVGQTESTNSVPTSGVTSDESIPEAISATSTRPQSRVPKRNSQLKMLKTQIDLQRKFHQKVSSSLVKHKKQFVVLNHSLKNIQNTMDSINENVADMSTTLKDLIAETKRHNLAMEYILKEKTRLNQQILELELQRINDSLI